jgi:hypothetical protein
MTEDNIISHDGLHYITGYFACHTKIKHNLGTHTSNMKPEDENAVQSKIMCLSHSGIVETREEFLKYWNTVFKLNHGPNGLHPVVALLKILWTYLKVDLLVEVVKIFVKAQTLIHLNSVYAKHNGSHCSNHRKSSRKYI